MMTMIIAIIFVLARDFYQKTNGFMSDLCECKKLITKVIDNHYKVLLIYSWRVQSEYDSRGIGSHRCGVFIYNTEIQQILDRDLTIRTATDNIPRPRSRSAGQTTSNAPRPRAMSRHAVRPVICTSLLVCHFIFSD